MAGIGFELRRLLKRENLLGLIQAYGYAGVISSGPWVLSIVGILIIGVLSYAVVLPDVRIVQFQVTVTYIIAISPILTGVFQLDKRRVVLFLTAAFVVLNFILTALTIQLGPAYYGYGFALALLIVVMIGAYRLSRTMARLEYETFMLQ